MAYVNAVESKEQVCSLALDELGDDTGVNNIDVPVTKQEKLCSRHYPHVKNILLEIAPWPWAMKQATLAAIDTWSSERYEYGYSLPDDFLKARMLWNGIIKPTDDMHMTPFDFAQLDGVRILTANVDTAQLIYTADIPVSQWPALFTEAVALSLAARLAPPMRADAMLAGQLLKRAEMALAAALESSLNEPTPEPSLDSVLVTNRGW